MAQRRDPLMSSVSEEPVWKQRAVERSTQAAKARAEQRLERFLDAAQLIMNEKGSTDFTVQEVVDRSRQSLRSFYLHFDGKHELLLALFEDSLNDTAEQIRTSAAEHSDPLDRLEVGVRLLFDLCRLSPAAQRPLFTDFASQLLISHPAEVKLAHMNLLSVLTELLTGAQEAGLLRTAVKPRRTAALIMQTVMFNAQSSGSHDDNGSHPITAEEIWTFCAYGVTRRPD
ncbi:TetR/AcrR family transcriptional regulator [Prauserella endophytica]|nr:TetR/AcrR family transcriptional regulator [Prauserella endophytica]